MKSSIDTSIITVNWNGAKHVENMIASLSRFSRGFSYEVIIVDNASETEDYSYLKTLQVKFPDIKIVIKETGDNLGFGKGNNIGTKVATGKYLAFINPDITFTENTLNILMDELSKNSKIGLIGPKLIQDNGKLVTSAMKKSSIFSIMMGQTLLPLARTLKLKTSGSFFVDQSSPSYPDWIYGSFMMLPRKLFEQVGGFDERYFMYAEEADLCLSVKQEGYLVRYYPLTSVIHEGEAVAKRVPDLTIQRKAESEYKFFTKWNGQFYASLNALINGSIFIIKGCLSFWRKASSKKLIKMGLYRLKQL